MIEGLVNTDELGYCATRLLRFSGQSLVLVALLLAGQRACEWQCDCRAANHAAPSHCLAGSMNIGIHASPKALIRSILGSTVRKTPIQFVGMAGSYMEEVRTCLLVVSCRFLYSVTITPPELSTAHFPSRFPKALALLEHANVGLLRLQA